MSKFIAIFLLAIGAAFFSFCQISSAPAEDMTWTKEESVGLETWHASGIPKIKCSIIAKGNGVIIDAQDSSADNGNTFIYEADVRKNGVREIVYTKTDTGKWNGGGYNVFVRHCAKPANAQLPKAVKEKFFGCCGITTK